MVHDGKRVPGSCSISRLQILLFNSLSDLTLNRKRHKFIFFAFRKEVFPGAIHELIDELWQL